MAQTDCPNPEIHSVNGGPWRYCTCGWIEEHPDPLDAAVAAALVEADWTWEPESTVPSPDECMRPIVKAAIDAYKVALLGQIKLDIKVSRLDG